MAGDSRYENEIRRNKDMKDRITLLRDAGSFLILISAITAFVWLYMLYPYRQVRYIIWLDFNPKISVFKKAA